MMTMTETKPSRRDRNMRDKRDRIFRAASELLAEQGFEAVTTQEIAERADVAAGTLFRYAATKGELLLMVYNEAFRSALTEGERRAAHLTDPTAAITALLEPVVARARTDAANSAAYQREVLFGATSERYRTEAVALVTDLEDSLARILNAAAERSGTSPSVAAVRAASASIFAAMHLTIARLSTRARPHADTIDDLRLQVSQIVAGALSTTTQTPGSTMLNQAHTEKEKNT